MLGTTLQRTIMLDLLKIFAVTLVGLTALFVLGGAVSEASQRGLAPAQILSIIPLMIPSTLPYTIPTAALFASTNVYGRMSKDNEITALRAAGINLWTIVKPSLLLGVLTSAATMGLFYETIPNSFQRVREQLLGDLNELLTTLLKRQGCIKHAKLPYVLFAREIHGERLEDVIFKRKSAGSAQTYDTVARAKEARIRIEQRRDTETGAGYNAVVVEMTHCWVIDSKKPDEALVFQNRQFVERLPADILGERDIQRSCDVTWPALFRRARELRSREETRTVEQQQFIRQIKSKPNPTKEELDLVVQFGWHKLYGMREYRAFAAEIHMRPALAVSCMCFVLLGTTIGVWARRADLLSSFVIGFLPIVMVYYPVLICCSKLAKEGRIPIPVGLWVANVLFAVVAVGMCWRLVRR